MEPVHLLHNHQLQPPTQTLVHAAYFITWNEALPIGNGRLAAMVFSDPGKRTNSTRMKKPFGQVKPGNNIPDTDFYSALTEIRRLIFDGKSIKKRRESRDAKNSAQCWRQTTTTECLISQLATCTLIFQTLKTNNYSRSLDINSAIQTTTYTLGKRQL